MERCPKRISTQTRNKFMPPKARGTDYRRWRVIDDYVDAFTFEVKVDSSGRNLGVPTTYSKHMKIKSGLVINYGYEPDLSLLINAVVIDDEADLAAVKATVLSCTTDAYNIAQEIMVVYPFTLRAFGYPCSIVDPDVDGCDDIYRI